LEASIVLAARFGESADKELDILLHKADIETVSLTSEQTELAREAWKRFGKGRHAAALNFGDCFSYALAKSLGAPLLFVGDDFGKTDITPA
jgi:ribonuclease VapC